MKSHDLDKLRETLAASSSVKLEGRVSAVTGTSLRLVLPGVRIGDVVVVRKRGGSLACEIVGFSGHEAIAMPKGSVHGIGPDDPVESTDRSWLVHGSDAVLGRVLNGFGEPIDGAVALPDVPIEAFTSPSNPFDRLPIVAPLETGVRAIDAFMTIGEGQRIGIFAGSGVGKSTLLGTIARSVRADVLILGLVGERGREVIEFLDSVLTDELRPRVVTVVATSDSPALERVRAAQVATRYAEFFRDRGARVVLLLDSLTRLARAQREMGLAAGEPPTRRGYPPSVFSLLPQVVERAGRFKTGSITGVYTVLVEASDLDEPIADEVRGLLDGHIVLRRDLAERGHYPAIDIPASLSRVMRSVVSSESYEAAERLRAAIAHFESKRDLMSLGAYAAGVDPRLDKAVAAMPDIEQFLYGSGEATRNGEETLRKLAGRVS